MDWARVKGFRKGENPARWKGHLKHLLPEKAKVQKVEHHPAMPYSKIPEFLRALQKKEGVAAKALTFTILTAARSGETRLAPWHEFDLNAALWTVPGERMKAERPHRIPLSAPALDIINTMKGVSDGGPFVFLGRKARQPLSDKAMLDVLERMGHELTVHGFRSSFRDWCAEQTEFPREVCEAALAHVNADKTEDAYLRSDLLEKRRELMAAWASYITV